ncbi:MAG: hypothetical protein M3154_06725 [Candidatus Eremiobacteraeota bacterium]|nr:hypothetical protein [Candidatus Eremiobacteraeota bacterium]
MSPEATATSASATSASTLVTDREAAAVEEVRATGLFPAAESHPAAKTPAATIKVTERLDILSPGTV